jgi:NADPH-dependent glutamate synthase beta subunit-like oxidoreductase
MDLLNRHTTRKQLQGVAASPPGVCPLTLQLASLQGAIARSCGKCVPCREGLPAIAGILTGIVQIKCGGQDVVEMQILAELVRNTADCAIGYDAANEILRGIEAYRDEYTCHTVDGRCQDEVRHGVPCVQLCPAGIDIPAYIALVREGRHAEAVQVIREHNPLPTACAYVCEHPCEDRCRRQLLDSAINIRSLKMAAVSGANAAQVPTPKPNVATGKRVAIVGAGPAGLSAAYYLALMGHAVQVFDANGRAGGMLRYGIPAYRLPHERLDEDIRAIVGAGDITINCGSPVGHGGGPGLEELEAGFDAVCLAIGAQQGKLVEMEGARCQGAYSAVEMLRELGGDATSKLATTYAGKRVVVIGGGNVAMDCSRSAVRLGASEVTVVYRRRREDMPALAAEVQEAVEEGVHILALHAPVRIEVDGQNQARALVARPQMAGEYDAHGRPKPVDAGRPDIEIPCDIVLMAIGQQIDSEPFAQCGCHPKTRVFITGEGSALASRPGVFAAGDCTTGPATVIQAIAAGRQAAIDIDEYLGQHHKLPKLANTPAAWPNDRRLYGRCELPQQPPGTRKLGFGAVEQPMSEQETLQECNRCLRCDHFGPGAIEGVLK